MPADLTVSLGTGLIILTIAFFSEYIDSSTGMGYGTILSPLLLFMGFSPLMIVPSILLSEFITGVTASITHHAMGNVNFRPVIHKNTSIFSQIREQGIRRFFSTSLPLPLRISLLIGVCSVAGTVTAVFLAVKIPKQTMTSAIGMILIISGLVIIITNRLILKFNWARIIFVGVIASFNKGLSGGGYGPIVTSGQLLAGLESKNAVAITSLAEALTCFTGLVVYFLKSDSLNFALAPYLCVGALLSVPLSGITVKKLDAKKFRLIIGILTLILGMGTFLQFVKP